jgi:hypothetical protein
MDVSEASGWDGDGLHRYHVLPGGLGPLALLAVLAPGGDVAVLSPRHMTLAAINRLVASDPTWAKPWKATNMADLWTKGTSGQTFPLETSQRSSMPPTVRFSTRCKVEEA